MFGILLKSTRGGLMGIHAHGPIEQHFLDYITGGMSLPSNSNPAFISYVLEKDVTGLRPNQEARALFEVIQRCFDGSGHTTVKVDSYLVHNLAACASIALDSDSQMEISWEEYDSVLDRVFNGLIRTLVGCIKEKMYTEYHGDIFVNGFQVPMWFAEWACTSWTYNPFDE